MNPNIWCCYSSINHEQALNLSKETCPGLAHSSFAVVTYSGGQQHNIITKTLYHSLTYLSILWKLHRANWFSTMGLIECIDTSIANSIPQLNITILATSCIHITCLAVLDLKQELTLCKYLNKALSVTDNCPQKWEGHLALHFFWTGTYSIKICTYRIEIYVHTE